MKENLSLLGGGIFWLTLYSAVIVRVWFIR